MFGICDRFGLLQTAQKFTMLRSAHLYFFVNFYNNYKFLVLNHAGGNNIFVYLEIVV